MIDPKQFHSDIEDIVEKTSCSYLDALISYQSKRNLEAETVSYLVKKNPLLKAKLHNEQQELKTVKPNPSQKLVF